MNYYDLLLAKKLGGGGGGSTDNVSGTFVTASEMYGIVDIDIGFKPDFIIVSLPFDGVDTTSYWWSGASWGDNYAFWNLFPAEANIYYLALDRGSGETGIQAINDNGFSFMSNSPNTQGVTCNYIAGKL